MEKLTFILTNDFGGLTRGRGFPRKDLHKYLEHGIGWVPANQAITPFDTIGDNPFGSHGDLRVIADPNAEVRVENLLADSPLHFYLGDIHQQDGRVWDLCPRSFLKASIAQLEKETGLRCCSAFEHEFAILDKGDRGSYKFAHAFSLQSYAAVSPLGPYLMDMLLQAGVEPEMFLPEFGPGQFEVTLSPAAALASADRAVILREIVKLANNKHGYTATFSPKFNVTGAGNGVHVHFSLQDTCGKSVMYDPERPGGLSEVAAQFSAGVLSKIRALSAFMAPSVISYLRLNPHQWSSAYGCIGMQNREAVLRICPAMTPTQDPYKVHHIEMRMADATASPYIVLGCLLRAGLEGIREELSLPALVNYDPDSLTKDEKEAQNIIRLPQTLPEALDLMTADEQIPTWFGAEFISCYNAMKKQEIKDCEELDDSQLCSKYAKIY